MSVVKMERRTERSDQSEVEVIARLRRWRAVLGNPMERGRANPDNDMFYLLLDAEEAIAGLRQYARHLEAKATQEPTS